MWEKIKQKKIILIVIIIIVVLGIIVYQFFIKEEKPELILEKVTKGTVLKEISETGAVKISEETNLGFKNAGIIEKIYVKVGDRVLAGQVLAELNTSQLLIQLKKAQAALEVAKAKKIDAQVSLENARQSLKDVEIDATEDLKQAYEDALNTLDDSHLKIYNALNVVGSIQRSYFTSNDQEGIKVRSNKEKIQNALNQTKAYIDDLKSNSQYEKIDIALSGVKNSLGEAKESLEIIRDMTETINYHDTVSSADKTSLDNQKSYITTAYTNIVDDQQTISTTKITNETNINSARAEISSLETQLQENGLYQAQINQAQTELLLLEDQIQEAVLRSPSRAQITKVNKREGETAKQTDSLISLLSAGPFQVEVDIYEEDIVNVRLNNFVRIFLPAFPDNIFEGRVISIDPSEKLINGVVYYEVNISFDTQAEGIKPGMTADIIIEGDKKEDVLVIPRGALKKVNGEKIVRVFKNGDFEEKKIETGLEGDEYIEVISGLEQGEQVIVGEEKK